MCYLACNIILLVSGAAAKPAVLHLTKGSMYWPQQQRNEAMTCTRTVYIYTILNKSKSGRSLFKNKNLLGYERGICMDVSASLILINTLYFCYINCESHPGMTISF